MIHLAHIHISLGLWVLLSGSFLVTNLDPVLTELTDTPFPV